MILLVYLYSISVSELCSDLYYSASSKYNCLCMIESGTNSPTFSSTLSPLNYGSNTYLANSVKTDYSLS